MRVKPSALKRRKASIGVLSDNLKGSTARRRRIRGIQPPNAEYNSAVPHIIFIKTANSEGI